MNIQEFEALRPGDRVRNAQGHEAVVVSRNISAVHIQWGAAGVSQGAAPTFALHRAGNNWWVLDVVPKTETCPKCGYVCVISGGAPCPACEQS